MGEGIIFIFTFTPEIQPIFWRWKASSWNVLVLRSWVHVQNFYKTLLFLARLKLNLSKGSEFSEMSTKLQIPCSCFNTGTRRELPDSVQSGNGQGPRGKIPRKYLESLCLSTLMLNESSAPSCRWSLELLSPIFSTSLERTSILPMLPRRKLMECGTNFKCKSWVKVRLACLL